MVKRIQAGRFCLWCLRSCRKTRERERDAGEEEEEPQAQPLLEDDSHAS